MTHLKRQEIPKKWPIRRKGTKYVVKPLASLEKSIPILIILRDILQIAKDRREVKKAIANKNILLNLKPVLDEKRGVYLFDVLTIVPSNEYYRIVLNEKGKFSIEKINEKESIKKISKIIGKKTLKGKKSQINLLDGNNLLYEKKCNINDSVVINLKDKKIEKVIELKENGNALVFAGKHSGTKGIINKINLEKKSIELKTDKGLISVLIKQIILLE